MVCFFCGMPLEEGNSHYGLHINCFCKWFQIDKPLEFKNIFKKNIGSDSPDKNNDITSSFFQGKFRKYSAELGNAAYILKVQEQGFPELPAVEFLSNQIAESLGLYVPEYFLINFHGAITFAVKNFLRPGELETLHHIYHFLEDTSFSCQSILETIREKTGRLPEMERFVKLCLFDSLIGNHDRHGRNLGLIEHSGKYRLSPFYDNPSYIGVEEESFLVADLSPRGRISVRATDEPVLKDYLIEFKRLGMEKAINDFKNNVKLNVLEELSGWQFISTARANALRKLIRSRFEELHG